MCGTRVRQVGVAVGLGLLVLRAGAQAASINVGSATGAPGSTVSIQVTLSAAGEQVGGLMNDLSFDPRTPLDGPCVVNPAFKSPLSAVALRPQGCPAGVNCKARALIAMFPPQPIADGSLLYTCKVKIAADAPPQPFPVVCAASSASDPAGKKLTVRCSNGQIQVVAPATGTGRQSAAPGDIYARWLMVVPVALLLGLLWHRRRRQR